MEQSGRSSGESGQNQQQIRTKMPENISQPPPPQPPPQKCPRCDSNNTKFCYYNNYSLTQPRYFCKTCRRYWTQGGTLRNVPVGGGCRKGKRTMRASSGGVSGSSSLLAGESSSRSHHHHHQQLPPQIENLSAAAAAFLSGNNSTSRSQPLPLPSMSSLFTGGGGLGGGGFLSSLAAMQSMSTQLSQGVNNQSSQLGLISASSNNNQFGNFNIPSSTPPKVQINQQMESGFYQMVNKEKPMESSFYPSDQTLQFQPTRPLGTWTQRFINNNNNNNIWPNSSISSSSSGGANSSTTAAGASLSPNQWPDLPGFGPSP